MKLSPFYARQKFTALPGSVYGGLVASLFDCHGTGSAAAFACIAENIDLENNATIISVRCVTASLKVDFKAPIPMELKGKLRSIEGRKIWVDMTLSADGIVCATGEILAIKLKD